MYEGFRVPSPPWLIPHGREPGEIELFIMREPVANFVLVSLLQDLHERFNKYGKEEWDY